MKIISFQCVRKQLVHILGSADAYYFNNWYAPVCINHSSTQGF